MIIDAIADLHGHYPKLEGGDLLIVAGDLTARDLETEHALFDYWLNEQNYKKKIVIAGNHDRVLAEDRLKFQFCDYLCDSGTEFEGSVDIAPPYGRGKAKEILKIWGSPWTLTFPGINPRCTAFTGTEADLKAKFALIPYDTDILITHGPAYGVLDRVNRGSGFECVGSKELMQTVHLRLNLKLHVFGHIHEGYGQETSPFHLDDDTRRCKHVNCSHVNEHYQPVNKPVRIIL